VEAIDVAGRRGSFEGKLVRDLRETLVGGEADKDLGLRLKNRYRMKTVSTTGACSEAASDLQLNFALVFPELGVVPGITDSGTRP
jgi:hypothetical protein